MIRPSKRRSSLQPVLTDQRSLEAPLRRHLMKHTILLVVTTSALVFCTKPKTTKKAAAQDYYAETQVDSGESNTAPSVAATAGFLRARDLSNPGSLKPTNAAAIVSAVSTMAQFYRTQPAQTSTGSGGCLSTVLGRHTYTVEGDQVSAKFFETDLAACFQADPSFSDTTVTKATLNFQHVLTCPEGDLRRYNGANVGAFQNATNPEECLAELGNLSATIYATIEKNNTKNLLTRTINIARIGGDQVPDISGASKNLSLSEETEPVSAAAKSSDGAKGCVMTSDEENVVTSSGCQTIISISDVWIPAIYPDNSYSQLTDKDLKLNPAAEGPYFAGGDITFSINGWKGSMNYQGPTIQPTWDARYGSSTVASGTFGTPVTKKPASNKTNAKASLNLQDGHISVLGQLNYLDLANAALRHPLAIKP